MKIILVLSMMLSFFMSCQKDEPVIPVHPDDKLNVIWQKRLHSESNGCRTMYPIVTDEGVIYGPKDCYPKMILRNMGLETGKTKWEWQEQESISGSIGLFNRQINENEVIILMGHEIYRINFKNGATSESIDWRDLGEYGRAESISGDIVFALLEETEGSEYSKLVYSDVNNWDWKEVYEIKEVDEFIPTIRMPGAWKDHDGSMKALFGSYLANRNLDSVIYTYTYYNLTADTIIWEQGGFDGIKLSGSAHPPILADGKAWIQTSDHVVCIRLSDGEELWRRGFEPQGEHLAWTPNIMVDDVLVVNPANQNLYGLDPENGNVLWKRTDSGATSADMRAHDGIVYFGALGTGKLYAVDVQTGDQLWAEDSPNEPHGSFYIGVDIDPELGYLYTSDGIYAMCIKLPER